MRKWLIGSAIWILAAGVPARAAGEIMLDVVGRVTHEGGAPNDAVRLSVLTRPEEAFGAKGSVKMGRGQQAGEITLSFEGARAEGNDRAVFTLAGDYSVFFGNEQNGVEISGSFKGAADLAPGEERVVSEMEVAGPGGRRDRPTRIEIVARARR